MDLIKVGTFFLESGLILVLIHLILEAITVYKIDKWLKKNKLTMLNNDNINEKYKNVVLSSEEYTQLKEINESRGLFILKKFSKLGINYLDFLFFQNLIDDYIKKGDFPMQEECNKLKKIIDIMLIFKVSILLRKFGIYLIKFSAVYAVILILYKKFF